MTGVMEVQKERCGRCGKMSPVTAAFCPRCGVRLRDVSPILQADDPPGTPAAADRPQARLAIRPDRDLPRPGVGFLSIALTNTGIHACPPAGFDTPNDRPHVAHALRAALQWHFRAPLAVAFIISKSCRS